MLDRVKMWGPQAFSVGYTIPPSTLNPNVNGSYIHQLNAFFWGPHIVGMFFIQCTFPLYLVDLEQILILGFLRVI